MKPLPLRPLLFADSCAAAFAGVLLLLGPTVPEAEAAIPGLAFLVVAIALALWWGFTGKRAAAKPRRAVLARECLKGFLAENVWTGGSR